ncbi:MAG: acyltransferase [Anaerolineae bacterium]|nr:acyltransferase [Anaerolineae bacterium]
MPDTQTSPPVRKSKKRQGVTLAQYVQHRNGVPLGAAGSLQNMFYRSLGAGSFAEFWQYWNPIWGYALGRYVYAPLRRILPAALALILTFAISGAVHDAAATLVRRSVAFLFTPWFFLMGVVVIVGQALRIDYSHRSWGGRVAINLTYILSCLLMTLLAF